MMGSIFLVIVGLVAGIVGKEIFERACVWYEDYRLNMLVQENMADFMKEKGMLDDFADFLAARIEEQEDLDAVAKAEAASAASKKATAKGSVYRGKPARKRRTEASVRTVERKPRGERSTATRRERKPARSIEPGMVLPPASSMEESIRSAMEG